MSEVIRILGLDPGLRRLGWGVIDVAGNRITHVAHGTITSTDSFSLAERLVELHQGLEKILDEFVPGRVAVEQTFVNKDGAATLKLGQARGIALLVPAMRGLPIAEYAPNHVKKAVVGAGHADKNQIHAMLKILLPGADVKGADAADALAIAICHAHNRGGEERITQAIEKADTMPLKRAAR